MAKLRMVLHVTSVNMATDSTEVKLGPRIVKVFSVLKCEC